MSLKLDRRLVFRSKSEIYVQVVYRTNRTFPSERAKNSSNDVGDGDEMDYCTNSESSDRDVSSSE